VLGHVLGVLCKGMLSRNMCYDSFSVGLRKGLLLTDYKRAVFDHTKPFRKIIHEMSHAHTRVLSFRHWKHALLGFPPKTIFPWKKSIPLENGGIQVDGIPNVDASCRWMKASIIFYFLWTSSWYWNRVDNSRRCFFGAQNLKLFEEILDKILYSRGTRICRGSQTGNHNVSFLP